MIKAKKKKRKKNRENQKRERRYLQWQAYTFEDYPRVAMALYM